MVHDWHHTLLYERLYSGSSAEFNSSADPGMFVGETDIHSCLQDLIHGRDSDKISELESDLPPLIVRLFSKSINSLRHLLKKEFVMPKLYDKIILLYGQEISTENVSKLMLRLQNLLKGRQILVRLLYTIVERSKLVDSLKKIILLA